jgi:hypothetical protein
MPKMHAIFVGFEWTSYFLVPHYFQWNPFQNDWAPTNQITLKFREYF